MLTIHRSSNAEAARSYFTEALSKEGEYYVGESVNAFWQGKLAKRLGLYGEKVTKTNFSGLLNKKNSLTKEKLNVRDVSDARCGYDYTWSAPKSLSLLYAITKDESLPEAHRYAYSKAMASIEAHAQTQANTSYGRFYESTGNVIFAPFDHFTSRPNEIIKNGKTLFLPDPQIHTHAYMMNITWSEVRNRYQALELGNIHKQASYFEAVYHSHLSHRLNQIGYRTRRTHDRYEIEGISRELIEKFSNRTKTINEVAKQKGITDPKAKGRLSVTTRNKKGKSVFREDELYQLWKERLTPEEYKNLMSLKGKHKETIRRVSVKEAIDLALEHFLERQSVIEEKRVLAYALKLGYGSLLPEDVERELNSRLNILRDEKDTITYVTTKEMVMAEDVMIEFATEGKGKQPPLYSSYKPKQDFLNDQQVKAVKEILSSTDKVTILKGAAGVGKTTLLTEIQEAVKSVSKQLFAIAPSAQASRSVLREKGFDSDTISSLLHNPKLQEKLRNNVLLVDEAGMVGVKTMSEILLLAKKHDSRVILSGDTMQHSSPEAGDALRILQEKAQLTTASVQKIIRQKPQDYREAVEKLSKGQTLEGYNRLDKMGAVKEIVDHDERVKTIAKDYTDSVLSKRSALIVSPTHAEGDMITQAVRDELKSKGRIQGKERAFETLKNLSLTGAQKKDLSNYHDGQVLVFTKNQRGGFSAGEHFEVLPQKKNEDIKIKSLKTGMVSNLPHQSAQYFDVYQKTQTEIAKGDLIRITRNSKSKEDTKLNNGNSYNVLGFSKAGDIKLSNGKTIARDMMHLTHGYVSTSHSSQGKDARDVFIAQSDVSFSASSQQQFYVSISRGTHSVSVYTSDKNELKKSITRNNERMTAREIADGHERRLLEQKQRTHHRNLNEKIKEHERSKQRQKPTPGKVFDRSR